MGFKKEVSSGCGVPIIRSEVLMIIPANNDPDENNVHII
jgi:hypothetical protein